MSENRGETPPPYPHKGASFLDTVRTVLWGMIGIRRRAAHEQANIRPLHVVILGILFVVLFVVTLRLIVGAVVS